MEGHRREYAHVVVSVGSEGHLNLLACLEKIGACEGHAERARRILRGTDDGYRRR